MAVVLLLSSANDDALPALEFLRHRVIRIPAEGAALVQAPDADVVFVDARTNLSAARAICRVAHQAHAGSVIAIVTEGGLTALAPDWDIDDVVLTTAGPAEIDARIRLVLGRGEALPVAAGGLTVDEDRYQARVDERPLDLTFKEFELLKFLAQHPDRVFTREQLLSEVWGYDYFGGTRTVDVHVRRLRAKLGDHDHVIGTVRNVGYRFDSGPRTRSGETSQD